MHKSWRVARMYYVQKRNSCHIGLVCWILLKSIKVQTQNSKFKGTFKQFSPWISRAGWNSEFQLKQSVPTSTPDLWPQVFHLWEFHLLEFSVPTPIEGITSSDVTSQTNAKKNVKSLALALDRAPRGVSRPVSGRPTSWRPKTTWDKTQCPKCFAVVATVTCLLYLHVCFHGKWKTLMVNASVNR